MDILLAPVEKSVLSSLNYFGIFVQKIQLYMSGAIFGLSIPHHLITVDF